MTERRPIPGKWQRSFDFDPHTRAFFTIATDRYEIVLRGGSLTIADKTTPSAPFRKKGFRYLYTGDVSPDENVLAALENGKHFYIFSLQNFGAPRRVTLPRGYESLDGYPSFSPDGAQLLVPAVRYDHSADDPGYRFYVCRYDAHTFAPPALEEVGADRYPAWPVPL